MYKDVIDIIAYQELDYKKIAIEFSKLYPEEFIKFFHLTHMQHHEWYTEYRNFMIAGEKIPAIKLFRDKTSASLYEAKRFADYIQYLLRVNNYPMADTNYTECSDINTVAGEYHHIIPFIVK